jgi:hypothetical protein
VWRCAEGHEWLWDRQCGLLATQDGSCHWWNLTHHRAVEAWGLDGPYPEAEDYGGHAPYAVFDPLTCLFFGMLVAVPVGGVAMVLLAR